MKTELKKIVDPTKAPGVIGFRPDTDTATRFYDATFALAVSSSELARRAYKLGFDLACREIAEEKKREAKELLKRFGKNRLSFNCGSCSATTRCDSHCN